MLEKSQQRSSRLYRIISLRIVSAVTKYIGRVVTTLPLPPFSYETVCNRCEVVNLFLSFTLLMLSFPHWLNLNLLHLTWRQRSIKRRFTIRANCCSIAHASRYSRLLKKASKHGVALFSFLFETVTRYISSRKPTPGSHDCGTGKTQANVSLAVRRCSATVPLGSMPLRQIGASVF